MQTSRENLAEIFEPRISPFWQEDSEKVINISLVY